MRIVLYVEGGGETSAVKSSCREAFRKLLERAGFAGSMPRIVACGSRNETFKDFKRALQSAEPDNVAVMLVDSEDPVTQPNPWAHLKIRDNWDQPLHTTDAQAQLMTTCMETWMLKR